VTYRIDNRYTVREGAVSSAKISPRSADPDAAAHNQKDFLDSDKQKSSFEWIGLIPWCALDSLASAR
jgi:hypothetical protein